MVLIKKMSANKIDTLDTVKTKIINNIRSLANTLQIASDDLRGKGYNVPDGQLYHITITMSLPSIDPEAMVVSLLERSKLLWDDLFALDPATITDKQVDEIKTALPSNLSMLVSPLLDCRDKEGKMALDTKILGLMITYVRAFVKLGLKIVFFKRNYEKTLGINLEKEIAVRKIEGLPLEVC